MRSSRSVGCAVSVATPFEDTESSAGVRSMTVPWRGAVMAEEDRAMPIRSVLLVPCVVALVALVTATAAQASATLTSPANGARVSFDKDGVPTFAWTLPGDEVDPQLYVAPQASVPD